MSSVKKKGVAIPNATKTTNKNSSKETEEAIPIVFSCSQNSPNPFRRSTTIKYGLPKNAEVRLVIYNLAGQRVRTLVDAQESAGYKSVAWDGCNSSGMKVPQGIYFYVLKAGEFNQKHKMILLK